MYSATKYMNGRLEKFFIFNNVDHFQSRCSNDSHFTLKTTVTVELN